MKVTLKLVAGMVVWTVVALLLAQWLNGVNLGSQGVHIAINLAIWLGGYGAIAALVMRGTTPQEREVRPDSRLRGMAWVLAIFGVAMVALGCLYASLQPLESMVRDPSLRSRVVLFVCAALFGVSCLVTSWFAFRLSGVRTQAAYKALMVSMNVTVLANLVFGLAVVWNGWAIAASTLLVTVHVRRVLPTLAAELLE